jgi:hypothetical protein
MAGVEAGGDASGAWQAFFDERAGIAHPRARANAPRERAVPMRSSGCGASPRPEGFRGYGNRRP